MHLQDAPAIRHRGVQYATWASGILNVASVVRAGRARVDGD